MKRISQILLFALVLAILLFGASLTAHAEEINQITLMNVCEALDQLIYPSVYQNSEGYEEFIQVLNQAKVTVSNQKATNLQVTTSYNSLRDSFTQLMKNTYDYSNTIAMASVESWLDQSLYETEGMKGFLADAEICRKELFSPHLYSLESRSTSEYVLFMQLKIDEIADSAVNKYNQLRLKKLPSNFNLRSLYSLTEAMNDTLRPELFTDAEGKEEFEEAFNAARDVLGKGKATEEEVNQTALVLIKKYNDYMRNRFDFSQIEQSLADAKTIRSDRYTEASYSPFARAVKELEVALNQPVFFYVSSNQIRDLGETYAQKLIDQMDDTLINAKDSLIELGKIDTLKELCEKYENIMVDTSLSSYQSALLMAVANGKDLIQQDNYTSKELDQAIDLINQTAENLKTATEEYNQEQDGLIRDHNTRIKLILTFTLITLALSIGLSVFLSIRENGKVDFSK